MAISEIAANKINHLAFFLLNFGSLIEPADGRLAYNGTLICDKGEMLSLTDMWDAAGRPENKRPAEWARYEGATFIEFVAETHNVGTAHILTSTRGRTGSTFAHWQIAIAYAKYLSPDFHMWCNSVVRGHMEGKAVSIPGNLSPEVLEVIERNFGIHNTAVSASPLAELLTPSAPVNVNE